MSYMNVFRNLPSREPPMNCKIHLTPDKSSYDPGDKVQGKLTVTHQKDFYTFGFKVALEGTALVKFKEREILQSKHVTLHESSVYVCGGGESRIRLAPTNHTYPFTLSLPKAPLPGSFKSPFGLIIYQVVAYLSTEYRDSKKAEKTITVKAFVNLALNNEASIPVQLEKADRSVLPASLPFISGKRNVPQFKFVLKLPQSGFLPGEEIPFMLEVDNPYAHEIKNMRVTLVQKIIFHAAFNSWKKTHIVVANAESAQMDSPYGTMWTGAINIPAKQYPTQSKSIIEQSYTLRVVVEPNGEVAPLKGEIPIIIGSVRISERPSPTVPVNRSFLDSSDSTTSYSVFRNRSPVCFSGASANSGICGPPSYSTLSLRTRSNSIETLPPAYDDAMKDSDKEESYSGAVSPISITLAKAEDEDLAEEVAALNLDGSQNPSP